MTFVDVGGSVEACFDGVNRVLVRQKGTEGPNFHLTRRCLLDLLSLFPPSGKRLDEFVVFEVYEGDRNCGSAALCLSWSEADVLTEFRSKEFPLAREDGHVAIFKGWPSDRRFTLEWGETVFRFVARDCA